MQFGSTEIIFKFGGYVVKLQWKLRERQNEVFTLALSKSKFKQIFLVK